MLTCTTRRQIQLHLPNIEHGMSQDFNSPPNPYASSHLPEQPQSGKEFQRSQVRLKVMLPAIFMVITAVIGLGMSVYSCILAFGPAPEVPANTPPALQEMMKNTTGTRAAITQGLFVLLNGAIIAGGIQMMRFKTWGFALAACILSMINLGSCCCVVGLPIGIWSLVVLLQPDVKQAF